MPADVGASGGVMNGNVAMVVALAAGLVAGAGARASGSDLLIGAAQWMLPLGAIWLNALKMTLVPLVFALVSHGMVSLDRSGGGGPLLAITLPLIAALMLLGMLGGMAFGVVFEALWPVTPGVADVLMTTTQGPPAPAPGELPSLLDLIIGLIPTNPFAAAAAGTLASVVIFAIVFGLAASRIDPAAGEPVIRVLHGLSEVMMRIVHWVLWFTPLGIFALSLGLALNTGLAMAGFLAQSVICVVLAGLLAIAAGYLLAAIGGGISPLRFGRAIFSAQLMAAGTTSSAATLPRMVEVAEQELRISERVTGAVLPLAVSIFRFSSLVYNGAVIILFMRATGMPIDPAKLAIAGVLLTLGVMSSGGLPGAAVIYAASVGAFQFLGLPLELIALMIAISALPDMIITMGNVTAHLAITQTVARFLPGQADPATEEPSAVTIPAAAR